MQNLAGICRNGLPRNNLMLNQAKYIRSQVGTGLNYVGDLDVSYGWIGIIHGRAKSIIFNDFNGTDVKAIPFDSRTINPVTLCRISWDLGLQSPGGFNSCNINEPEMGFSLYLEDFLEHKPYDNKKLLRRIWSKLKKTDSMIEIPD